VPLYLAGHRLQAHYPVGFALQRQGMMMTVASYIDTIGFGLISDPKLVPDLWHLLDLVKNELQQLMDQSVESSASAPESTSLKKSTPTKKSTPAEDRSADNAGQSAKS
jgi:hypothetical protein